MYVHLPKFHDHRKELTLKEKYDCMRKINLVSVHRIFLCLCEKNL